MTSLLSKRILAICLFTYGFNVNAADIQDHQISIDKLEHRKQAFRFQTPKDAKLMLVRSHIDDLPGFTLKDQRKDEAERLKFNNQFNIKAADKALTIYQQAQQWKISSFATYLFGLYSIYQLDEATATFCGEVNLSEESLNQLGFIEMTIDIDPTKRSQGIGTITIQAVLDHILTPNLGKKQLSMINYHNTSNKSAMIKKGFSKSLTALAYLKSTIAFDNLASYIVHQKVGMTPNNFSVDYSVVYTYPPMTSSITPQALPLVRSLTSSSEEERKYAIKVLTHSIDNSPK
jgi:RimJ/RimL family protein N-acetyltransferase